MKRKITLLFSIASMMLFVVSTNVKAQTSGTLTFKVNPVSHNANYGLEHVVAIWVQTGSTSTFVKTKYSWGRSSDINQHLAIWKAKSGGNVVDATTGATSIYSYSPITVTWNGTNVSSGVVTDGVYRILVEFAWGSSTTIGNGKDTMSVTFNKSTSAVHLTPADKTNFTGIDLDWVPSGASVKENEEKSKIDVYPSLTRGLVNVNFKEEVQGCIIKVYNQSGALVYVENSQQSFNGIKTLDLSKNANGVYFVKIQKDTQSNVLKYKIVLDK
jgi:hypothetical protein